MSSKRFRPRFLGARILPFGWLALALPIALLLSWESPPAAETPTAETNDSCVDCHSDPDFLVTNKKLYNYFQEWKLSIHRAEEVACSDCHGGDPENPEKNGAHEGGVGAAQKQSAVNFENIPATCGQCHDDILNGYRQSPHFAHLVKEKQERQGPSCVTCHGSINSAALNVVTVEEACSRCHNEETENHPEIPNEAKNLLNKFLSIHRYYRYISVRGDPAQTAGFFKDVDREIHALSINWHTFDLCKIERKTAKVLAMLKEKRNELRKQRMERSRQPGLRTSSTTIEAGVPKGPICRRRGQ